MTPLMTWVCNSQNSSLFAPAGNICSRPLPLFLRGLAFALACECSSAWVSEWSPGRTTVLVVHLYFLIFLKIQHYLYDNIFPFHLLPWFLPLKSFHLSRKKKFYSGIFLFLTSVTLSFPNLCQDQIELV